MSKKLDEAKAYEAERARANADVVEQSAYRRMGRLVKGDPHSWPDRTETVYDPRRR